MDSTSRNMIELANALAKRSNRSVSTLSRLATGSGDTIRRLENGKRITTVRAEKAISWFSDNWLADLDWPADIPRPDPREEKAA